MNSIAVTRSNCTLKSHTSVTYYQIGSVWISRGFNEEAFTEVDLSGLLKISPAPVGSEHYVSGILYSAYSWDADSGSGSNPDGPALIPVVYVTFSCGNVAVICLQTSALVAYGLSEENEDLASSQSIVKKKWLSTSKLLVGGKDGDDDSDITDTNTLKLVVAAVVTDSVNEVIHAPKCRATYSSNRSVVDGKEVLSFSFVSLTRQEACSGNIQSQEQTSTRSRASSTVDAFATFRTPKGTEEDTPSNVLEIPTPRYLLVTVWKSLVKYDISKFSRLTIPVSGGRSKRSYSISAPSVEALESLEVIKLIYNRLTLFGSYILCPASCSSDSQIVSAPCSKIHFFSLTNYKVIRWT